MTIPPAPLPSVSDLARGFVSVPSAGAPWLADGGGRRARFFERASMALAAAAAALRGGDPDGRWRLWLPEYFCDEALAPARRLGIPLRFYPVRDDLGPRFPADLDGPGALVLVHYFGFPNILEEARAACRRAGLSLIEDAAHVLAPRGGIGSEPWVVYSPRKLLAVPSGGLLVHPEGADPRLPAVAGAPKAGDAAWWALRRLAQSALRTARVSWHRRRPDAAAAGRADAPLQGASGYGLRLLATNERGLGEVARRRRENFLFLKECADGLAGGEPMRRDLPADVCPYAFPLRVPDAERAAGVLQAAGIPACRWPDLPREAVDPVARRLAAETLLLPVHQSLTRRELGRMRDVLRGVLSCR